jgi:hypothetical protein
MTTIDDVREHLSDATSWRNRWIGVYIGALAVMLAICSSLGSNAAKEAARANLDAANLWAFFQAKNMRRTSYSLAADNLELMLKTQPALTPEARADITKKMADYRATVERYTSDKERDEGLDELFAKAKATEQVRDLAASKDPYFDWSQALLQISIVLASISIISSSVTPFFFSLLTALAGAAMMLNGNLLLFQIPFIA